MKEREDQPTPERDPAPEPPVPPDRDRPSPMREPEQHPPIEDPTPPEPPRIARADSHESR
ncbi:MAG: hypothetical protein C4334_08360 [Pyrinomonas sp.]|uniref:hypothetical protein n=1 Tax=Pyrinomonas sp. TaxID=2080306 RepID=UPI003334235D